ncbi:MAG: F0F1 ATP synthase subunit A [Actinobacteria bacterium]|nr:F0F1 ATP synthase subunit A [Actinomycetota bacterium]
MNAVVLNKAMLWAGGDISVGDHKGTREVFGLSINFDVVWSSLIAAAIVLGLGFLMVRKITDGVPGKLQLFFETVTEQVTELADSAMPEEGRRYVPLAVCIFLFVLTCNWLEIIPTEHWMVSPTADVNLPLAMALTVIVWVHIKSFKVRGIRGYFAHYAQPYKALIPINIIEELTKPITLTFRLFGNMFSGGLMVVVISSLLPIYIFWVGELIWKPFDMFVGAIQAFIFALLTIMYFGMATTKDGH